MTTGHEGHGRVQDRLPGEPARVWEVLIESNVGEHWLLEVSYPPLKFATLAQARAVAEAQTRTFRPADPFKQVRRTVYRTGEDRYLVAVEGLMSTFQFTVQVGEQVAVVEY
ncbi:hypothetical protein E1263_16385 [Kribbella antibiotica]|uniref:Uncharacterized protein n=1 Tax=Kribbella antibiotica TaxID=190195 RepID=A0A4R4ZK78_9ACTN|nr:hypothetical protein [Kribbella antibiotica]TDD59113.1 hypothetical protein E1263_16385 [Kribbella antibiotica]